MLLPLLLNLSAAAVSSPVVEQSSGGWAAYNYADIERTRRRRAKQLKEESEEIEDKVDREIARLLHEQEELDAARKERDRLSDLAARYAKADDMPERVRKAALRAQLNATASALEAMGREIERARDEEEIAALMVLLNQ
jgi:hypothetical protein